MYVRDAWTQFENVVQNIRSMVIAHKTCNKTLHTENTCKHDSNPVLIKGRLSRNL